LVTSWADTEIVVEGFPPFEPGRNVFNIGDVIKIEVASPQQRGSVSSGDNFSGAPVAWFSVRVGGETPPPPVASQAHIAAGATVPTTRGDVTIPAASLETDLKVNGTLAARKGADVYGRLAQAKEAGHVAGSSELQLELTRIVIDGQDYPLVSSDYTLQGKGRGKNTAEKVGGGAALGALIGGIAGGGKGAAIGAGVGAGAGGTVQVLTRGQQVKVPSETLLEFRLQQSVTVTSTH